MELALNLKPTEERVFVAEDVKISDGIREEYEFLKLRGIREAFLPNELQGFSNSLGPFTRTARTISRSAVAQRMSEFGCFSGAQFHLGPGG